MSHFQWQDVDLNSGKTVIGTISNIDYEDLIGDVEGIGESIPIHYHCIASDIDDDGDSFHSKYPDEQDRNGAAAFVDGDLVLVMYRRAGDIDPLIVGFPYGDKECGVTLFIAVHKQGYTPYGISWDMISKTGTEPAVVGTETLKRPEKEIAGNDLWTIESCGTPDIDSPCTREVPDTCTYYTEVDPQCPDVVDEDGVSLINYRDEDWTYFSLGWWGLAWVMFYGQGITSIEDKTFDPDNPLEGFFGSYRIKAKNKSGSKYTIRTDYYRSYNSSFVMTGWMGIMNYSWIDTLVKFYWIDTPLGQADWGVEIYEFYLSGATGAGEYTYTNEVDLVCTGFDSSHGPLAGGIMRGQYSKTAIAQAYISQKRYRTSGTSVWEYPDIVKREVAVRAQADIVLDEEGNGLGRTISPFDKRLKVDESLSSAIVDLINKWYEENEFTELETTSLDVVFNLVGYEADEEQSS